MQVVGVPCERMGEEVAAFVRLSSQSTSMTQAAVKEFSKGKIAHFKVPKYVIPVEEFPKTVSGKIQKFKLKENFEKVYRKNLEPTSS